jgi:Predicted inhibitor of MCP methylation, homolog of CheC
LINQQLTQPYFDSAQEVIQDMAGIKIEAGGYFYPDHNDIFSYGVASIITFMGKIKGRLLLDLDPQLAIEIARSINDEEFTNTKEFMVLTTISEVNNVIAGKANTYLNNTFSLGLRLAPPIVFTGKKPIVCIPKINSESIDCYSKHGRIRINVAFEGGAVNK